LKPNKVQRGQEAKKEIVLAAKQGVVKKNVHLLPMMLKVPIFKTNPKF
jgi:hypothetical protein